MASLIAKGIVNTAAAFAILGVTACGTTVPVMDQMLKRDALTNADGTAKLGPDGKPLYGPLVPLTGAYADNNPGLSTQTMMAPNGGMYEKEGPTRGTVGALTSFMGAAGQAASAAKAYAPGW